MATLKSILVPLDGSVQSKGSIPYVHALSLPDTKVTLLQVLPELRGFVDYSGEQEFGVGFDPWAECAAEMRAKLQEFALELTQKILLDSSPAIAVVKGDPADTILSYAKHHAVDIIIMTTRGQGVVKRALFGSVAERVLRNAVVPVLVVRPSDDAEVGVAATIQRIVVPLDGSPLAEAAVPIASSLALRLEIPIVLVHALQVDLAPGLSSMIPEESLARRLQFAYDYLSSIRDHLLQPGLEVWTAVNPGYPLDVIDAAAGHMGIIVMTSHGRTGFKRWLLGSTAEKLVHYGAAPVILVPSNMESASPPPEQESGSSPLGPGNQLT